MQRRLGYPGGTLIANPVPLAAELTQAEIGSHIEQAVDEAAAAGVSGKAGTPHLLDRLFTLTGGRSLTTNIALIKNNADLAARIAWHVAVPA